jgi:GABA permease
MVHVLIVANQTLRSDELIAAVLVRNSQGPCEFHVLVPATPLSQQEQALRHSEHPGAVVGESGPVVVARMRLAQALKRLAEANIDATGDVGDPNPLKAIEVTARHRQVDEIIVSTLPRRMSRWMANDLPRRAHRRLGLPVSHVETGATFAPPAAKASRQPAPPAPAG